MVFYLVGFDRPGQLWGKKNVLFLCRVVDVDQHPTLGIRQVQSVVDVCPAALLRLHLLIRRLTADLQRALVTRT